jgi:hypothetical protein
VFDSTYLEPNTGNPFAVKGVVINWDTKALGGDNSLLLDTTPATSGGTVDPFTHQTRTGFEDAPLASGRSFNDPRTGLTATVTSVGDLGANVTIAYVRGAVDVATPTVPGRPVAKVSKGKVTLTWAAAHDAWGVTGYIVTRNGKHRRTVHALKVTDKPGTGKFKYRIRAIDAAGNISPPSAVRAVKVGK